MNLGSRRCCVNNFTKETVGLEGVIGAYGPIGEIGITGRTGPFGLQGATGLCYRGYKGPQGPIGSQGGLTGNAGSIGPTGPTGNGSAINNNFTFTIGTASYNSSGFTNLTSTSYPITITSGTYSINFEINENWYDPSSKFYVQFMKASNSSIQNSSVFTSNSPLIMNTNNTNLYGIGNDVITFTNSGTYYIQLFQSTNSSTPINISGKTIQFSITFVKLS